ncbi:hypothetical protein B0H11DRAFT_90612 [Mycena galericulata]|nr:hypothetical protein B0H11DRAFT_90612 [Mycena galericulata]
MYLRTVRCVLAQILIYPVINTEVPQTFPFCVAFLPTIQTLGVPSGNQTSGINLRTRYWQLSLSKKNALTLLRFVNPLSDCLTPKKSGRTALRPQWLPTLRFHPSSNPIRTWKYFPTLLRAILDKILRDRTALGRPWKLGNWIVDRQRVPIHPNPSREGLQVAATDGKVFSPSYKDGGQRYLWHYLTVGGSRAHQFGTSKNGLRCGHIL